MSETMEGQGRPSQDRDPFNWTKVLCRPSSAHHGMEGNLGQDGGAMCMAVRYYRRQLLVWSLAVQVMCLGGS